MSPTTVAVVYHMFPHYRAPIMRELTLNGRHLYQFWGDIKDQGSIKAFQGDKFVQIHRIKCRSTNGILFLSGYWRLFSGNVKVVVLLGNPHIIDTWIIALAARIAGKKVLFWSHGWLRPERPLKRWARNLYFSLADRVLVYGERAVSLAGAAGFDSRRVKPIFNSLDWKAAEKVYAHCSEEAALQSPTQSRMPVIVCTARLTEGCRFDLLLNAASILKELGKPIEIYLIGDGSERDILEALAQNLGVTVHFLGAIYEEEIVGRYIYNSDITVSPGKVGLTAMHSLSYGTPVITHGDLNGQMPEVEAIVPGVTGAFFESGSAQSLAETIESWLSGVTNREACRHACRAVIADRYTPASQRRLIDAAIDEVLNGEVAQTA